MGLWAAVHSGGALGMTACGRAAAGKQAASRQEAGCESVSALPGQLRVPVMHAQSKGILITHDLRPQDYVLPSHVLEEHIGPESPVQQQGLT